MIHVHGCAPGWTDIGEPAGRIPSQNRLGVEAQAVACLGRAEVERETDQVVEDPAVLETTGSARVVAKPPTRNVWTPVKERGRTRSRPEIA